MLEVYTDTSVAQNTAVSTYFVISPNKYIGYGVDTYEGINSSFIGELYGILKGLRFAIGKAEDNEEIIINCDNVQALDFIQKSNYYNKGSLKAAAIVFDIKKLMKAHNVTFNLYQGHQSNTNPNKIVDLVSRKVLRVKLKEEAL